MQGEASATGSPPGDVNHVPGLKCKQCTRSVLYFTLSLWERAGVRERAGAIGGRGFVAAPSHGASCFLPFVSGRISEEGMRVG